MQFKNLIELQDYFKDEATCIEYYEAIRWNGNPSCPFCGTLAPYKTNRGYKCANKDCHKKFTVKVGTIFENSKISFRVWFAAIFLATTSKKGVSSLQLASQLGITQKTAWFVLHRVREMLKAQAPAMIGETGPVEADEAYIGGREKNKHANKRTKEGEPDKKQIVLGLIERNGKVILKHIPAASVDNMVPAIQKHVPAGKTIYSDESRAYGQLGKWYDHSTVTHSLSVYVDGSVHTNTIENFWSILKRGIYGIYHQVSEKHLERYLDEFSARFNERHNSNNGRVVKFLQDSEKRLTYKRLIAKR